MIAVDKLRAPVGQNVRLDVTAPDFDVIHSWWIPALGGKFDAIPGDDERDLVQRRGAGDLPRPVRRALRHPARRDDGRGRGDAARRSSRLARRGGRRPGGRARPTSARRRSPASARSATGSRAKATSGPRLAGNALLADPSGARAGRPERPRSDAAGRHGLGRAPDRRADRLPLGRRAQMAVRRRDRTARSRLAARPRRELARRPSTTSGSGSSTSSTSGLFFVAGGIMALLIRTQLAQANEDFIDARRATTSSSRCTGRRWSSSSSSRSSPASRNFLVPADDRRARHGLPAAERALVLALPLRRRHPAALVLRGRRRGPGRLDELPADLRLRAGQRPGPLDPLAAHPHDLVARRRDQLRRHDPQPAHAGDDAGCACRSSSGRSRSTRSC